MASAKQKALQHQQTLIRQHGAEELQTTPYFNHELHLDIDSYLGRAMPLNSTARVFYLPSYIDPAKLERYLTCVPAVCTGGDEHIVLQNGRSYGSLVAAKADSVSRDSLVTNPERRLSRKKSVASFVKVFAKGGYPYSNPLLVFDEGHYFDCVVVSGAGPQFEARYLDYSDFIFHKPPRGSKVVNLRNPEFDSFGPIPEEWDVIASKAVNADALTKAAQRAEPLAEFLNFGHADKMLHVTGFMKSIYKRCGYFKLVAIGTGFFAQILGTRTNIGQILQPLLLRAAIDVLEQSASSFPHISNIEFPDFSREQLYTPPPSKKVIGGIELVPGPRQDILDFPPVVAQQNLIPGVLNPGDCFALVGNETSYGSVEAMIGCNTTLRINQNYIWNETLLDEANYIAVDLSH